MTETGTVTHIEGNLITVNHAKDCGKCKTCKDTIVDKTYRAVNSRNLTISLGDIVSVYISPTKAIKAAFMVFIMPLLLFFISYFLAQGIGITSELMRVIFGTIGITCGFLFNLLIRIVKKQAKMPVIMGVEWNCENPFHRGTKSDA